MPADLLAAHGPVSPETAAALAEGVRERCAATWGIGLTGVAGPDPVDGHGPGRVYLGDLRRPAHRRRRLDLPGDRAAVRAGAVAAAMDGAARPGSADRGNAPPGPRCYAISGRAPVGRTWAPAPRTVSARRHLRAPPLPRSQDRRRP